MLYVILYVASIAGINWAFALLGANVLTNSIAGGVFILRDAAQRQIGHWVIAAMAVAIGLSYLVAAPEIAFASAVAFGVSECIDWAVYSATRAAWRDRMLLSSAISAPVDSALFLWLSGFWSFGAVATMTLAKIGVAFLLYVWIRKVGTR
jgi:uncharacterized PurR-regulated membrane protein YhhQ (DUF165 family)